MKRLLAFALVALFAFGGTLLAARAVTSKGDWTGTLNTACLPEHYRIEGTIKRVLIPVDEFEDSSFGWEVGEGTATGVETGKVWSVAYREVHIDAFSSGEREQSELGR